MKLLRFVTDKAELVVGALLSIALLYAGVRLGPTAIDRWFGP